MSINNDNKGQTGWRFYWLALIVAAFGIPEFIAIKSKQIQNTFSASWWAWLGTFRKGAPYRWERVTTFLVFWIALGVHFAFGLHAWPGLILPACPLGVFVLLSTFRWKE
jgi:hypothetical protein